MGVQRVSVRYDKYEKEFTMRCDGCASAGQMKAYWPLSLEFWNPKSGLQRCRACLNATKRLAHHQTLEERNRRAREYYWKNRPEKLAARAAYHKTNREQLNEHRRAVYAAKRAAKVAQDASAAESAPV